MERIIDVAQYIYNEYKQQSGKVIDEMKLHKLLCLSQRENLAIINEPMFPETFEGLECGPVSKKVHELYTKDGMYYENKRSLSAKASYIAKNVILQYGSLSSQELSELSHKEISWRNARMKLASRENGSVPLSIEDIRKDAEKVRPYDSVYDMYYDEFEDTVVAQ